MLLTHSLNKPHEMHLLLLFLNNVAMIKLISDYNFKTGSHYSTPFFLCFDSSVSHCKFTQSTLNSEDSASEPLSALKGNVGQVIFLVGQGCSRIHFFFNIYNTLLFFTFFFLAISWHVLCEGLQMRRTHLESAFERAFELGQSSPWSCSPSSNAAFRVMNWELGCSSRLCLSAILDKFLSTSPQGNSHRHFEVCST